MAANDKQQKTTDPAGHPEVAAWSKQNKALPWPTALSDLANNGELILPHVYWWRNKTKQTFIPKAALSYQNEGGCVGGGVLL